MWSLTTTFINEEDEKMRDELIYVIYITNLNKLFIDINYISGKTYRKQTFKVYDYRKMFISTSTDESLKVIP